MRCVEKKTTFETKTLLMSLQSILPHLVVYSTICQILERAFWDSMQCSCEFFLISVFAKQHSFKAAFSFGNKICLLDLSRD